MTKVVKCNCGRLVTVGNQCDCGAEIEDLGYVVEQTGAGSTRMRRVNLKEYVSLCKAASRRDIFAVSGD